MHAAQLFYLTGGFPYRETDAFSADELPFLRELPANIHILPTTRETAPPDVADTLPMLTVGATAKLPYLLQPDAGHLAAREWFSQKQRGNSPTLRRVLGATASALHARNALKRLILTRQYQACPLVVYSFWMIPALYGMSLLKKEFPQLRVVSRAHGFDLYPHRHPGNHLPFNYMRHEWIDVAAPCSQQGYATLLETHFTPEQVHTAFLGAPPQAAAARPSGENEIHLVSLSYITGVKRLPLLVRSLKQLALTRPDLRIVWHHIGNGPDEDELHRVVAAELDALPNVSSQLHGFMDNASVRHFLGNHEPLDMLVNVSESEGLPVSMMEALAVGLPVLGTDVGGVSEIVTAQTGRVIPKDFTTEQFIDAVLSLKQWGTADIRQGIKKFFTKNFNLYANHKDFTQHVLAEQLRLSAVALKGAT
jgi:Glycosyltransferase